MKTNTEATQNEATAAAVAEQGANAAPEQAAATKTATSKKGAPKGQKAAKKAAAKNHDIKIESSKNEADDRVYRIMK